MMIQENRKVLSVYLERQGCGLEEIEKIESGFDLAKPVYEQRLSQLTVVYQFARKPSVGNRVPRLGNWFCLSGATRDGLAIFEGLAGRWVAEVRVEVPFVALEGTAAQLSRDWKYSIGGKGGMTQIFVPQVFIKGNLRVTGFRDAAPAA